MKLQRFNKHGLQRFAEFLDALVTDPGATVPLELLSDPDCVDDVTPNINVESRIFANRMEAAAYLDSIVSTVTTSDLQRDVGLWVWLTLFFFDQVCPPDGSGQRKVKSPATYIPQVEASRRFYRHALLGPYLAFRSHRDDPSRAAVLLADRMNVTTSEGYRLFIETPLVNMPAPVEVATRFYFNPVTGKLRRGTGTKGGGGMRRLIAVLQQLDVTFDIHRLSPIQLVQLLPLEFKKWQKYSPQLW